MGINTTRWEMKEPIVLDSFENIPDPLGWFGKYMIFDLTYGNLANESALMTAFGVSADNVIINVVEMIATNMTKAEIIGELKLTLSDRSEFGYFVSNYGTYTLFDTLVSNVIELHKMYNSEGFEFNRTNIEFYEYANDSIAKAVKAKMESNYRPAICSYWDEEATYRIVAM